MDSTEEVDVLNSIELLISLCFTGASSYIIMNSSHLKQVTGANHLGTCSRKPIPPGGHYMGPSWGWTKQYKSMVILRDVPYYKALFGLVM